MADAPARKPRLAGRRVHLCSGYIPGETRLVAAPATTPECEPHEPQPDGYVERAEWAEVMMDTHTQRKCRGCGLWLIWEPRETG
jgi:hypothetical protein